MNRSRGKMCSLQPLDTLCYTLSRCSTLCHVVLSCATLYHVVPLCATRCVMLCHVVPRCATLYYCGVRQSSELRKYQISQSEIPSGDVKCGTFHSETRGFAKHLQSRKVTSPDGKMPEAIGNLVLFFFYLLVVSLDICG